MQPPKNSDSPEEHPPLRINLAKEQIGWNKYKPLFRALGSKLFIGILFVLCSPLLPFVGILYLFDTYQNYRNKKAVEKGVLPGELSASQKTTAYLSKSDISGFLGTTDIEYSQNPENVSFHYHDGKGNYKVYGTYEEGLFLLIPRHCRITPDTSKSGPYYACEVVRVEGGYNHGDFGEKSPMGSSDCIVLVCKKALKFPPSRDLIVIRRS
jgi:hypothetical protein